MKVQVKKLLGRTGPWTVHCAACASGGFDFLPWAQAANHRTALVLAEWHIALHRRDMCGTCGHASPIPKPTRVPGEPAMVKLAGSLYRVTSSGVRELVVAA